MRKTKKLLILACLMVIHHAIAWAQDGLTDYKYVYTLKDVERQIGGYDYSEFTLNPVKSTDSVLINITDVNGVGITTSLYLINRIDTLCLKSDTAGMIKIPNVELVKYNRYFIPEKYAEYEKMSNPLMAELHSPLDWRILMNISSLHIVLKSWDVTADYYLFSKIPLTEYQIDELRKDIIYDTKFSPLYDSVIIHGAVRL